MRTSSVDDDDLVVRLSPRWINTHVALVCQPETSVGDCAVHP